jgi:hypothetical protein
MIFGTIQRLALAGKQKKLANKINPVDVTYEASPYAKEMLAGRRQRMNSRMAGADAAGRSLQQNKANVVGTATRNATSGAQMLSVAAAAQGQADSGAARLQQMENSNDQANANALDRALGTNIAEGDKVFNDKMRKFMQERRAKDALMQSSMQNKAAAWDGLDNGIASIAGAAFGGPLGKKVADKIIK